MEKWSEYTHTHQNNQQQRYTSYQSHAEYVDGNILLQDTATRQFYREKTNNLRAPV
jgi:hypothetical protein